MTSSQSFWRSVRGGYFLATVGVLLGTGVLWLLQGYFSNQHMGLVYILLVASAAAAGGTRPAIVAAVLSFLLWNFMFLPPRYTFYIENWQDWLLLLVYLTIGLLVGQITGHLRAREDEALARERDTAALYHAIQTVATETHLDEVLATLVEQVRSTTGASGCAIVEAGSLTPLAASGATDGLLEGDMQRLMRWSIEQSKAVGLAPASPQIERETPWPVSVSPSEVLGRDPSRGGVVVPVSTRDRTFGVLYAVPTGQGFTITGCRVLLALASQAATFLERRRLLEEAAATAADRETERLKGVLFSSLSHNLKTPLASLAATLSSLREGDVAWDATGLRESFNLMAEDIERLTLHIDNLLNLAQLESGNWQPARDWFEPQEIISMALRHLSEGEDRRVEIVACGDLPLICVDPVQMAQVLRHLIENALDYSPPDSRVVVEARVNGRQAEFTVDDAGPGIAPAEEELIFRKFYRGLAATSKAVRGTGLGLAICKEVIHAHAGKITVGKSPLGGSRFRVVLPLEGPTPAIKVQESTLA